MTDLSTTVLSTKNWFFGRSQFYPILEMLLKIPLYPLYLQINMFWYIHIEHWVTFAEEK